MKKLFLTFIFCMSFLTIVLSQQVLDVYSSQAWSKVFITNRPFHVNNMEGNQFINADWQLADIICSDNNGKIEGYPVRLDARANLIEINDNGVIKVLHATNTYSVAFKVTNEVFITNKTLGIAEPVGFYKVLYSEKSSLLCHYSTKIIEGAYNPVLDAGIKEDKMLVEKIYYLFKDGELTKLENKRRKLIKQFIDQPEISEYIKLNRIIPTNETDLIKLITYMDSKS